jgi:hypothetical protein
MPDTMATLFLAGVNLDDVASTSALLRASHPDVTAGRSEPTVIGYALVTYREARRNGRQWEARVAEGTPLYVSDAVRKAEEGERFVARIQEQNPGLSVRWLTPRGWWPGWDAEPPAAAVSLTTEMDLHDRIDQLEQALQAANARADASTARATAAEEERDCALNEKAAWVGERENLRGQLAAARAQVAATEYLNRNQVDVIDAWERRHPAGSSCSPAPVRADDGCLVWDGAHWAPEAATESKATDVVEARSEVRAWIYVRGAGWWDGPWQLDDQFARDDVGTVVPLDEVSATSQAGLEQLRNLPGSSR